jgi:ribosome-associated protein YbcJ (S4-like RNA binding protein)
MLEMKDDLDELLKTKGKRKEETIDLDECLKIKGLRDNRGEARMLLKAKAVIALVSANEVKKGEISKEL